MTDNIDHAAEALALIRKHTNGLPSAQVVAAAIEAHATLALVAATEKVAEQARIANLIALTRSGFGELMSAGHDAMTEQVPHPDWPNTTLSVIHPEIRKGLGL